MTISDEALEVVARAIFGTRAREWTVMEELACTSQAKRAMEAAAPYMLTAPDVAPPVMPRPCTERHSHPDPAYMCMAPEGHK